MGFGDDRLGEVVGGRYVLRSVVGRGGQSVVYRAKDQVAGDEVAVKVVHRGNTDGVERLYKEAHALVLLSGTSALRVLHQATAEDGAACLVTELLRGQDLSEKLQDYENEGGRMPIAELLTTMEPVIQTLAAAHELDLVHRDIKPENVFVIHPAYGGGVRLLDFGFTRFLNYKRQTQPGLIAGSPTYIAPEIWSGQDEYDERVDIYSLAVVLFRALAGEPPFKGDPRQILIKVLSAQRPSLHALRPDLPPMIDDWVASALAVDPDHRFQRVTALWNALKSCLDVRRLSIAPPSRHNDTDPPDTLAADLPPMTVRMPRVDDDAPPEDPQY